ncbi:MAG: ribosome recycling factor [Chloroflexota bacterium]
MTTEILEDAKRRMRSSVEALERDLAGYRTNRASPALVEGINVDYQGMEMPLNQLAQVSVSDSRVLVIQPWDKTAVKAIEKAIMQSDLGVTPSIDGAVLRLVLPPLTEDRRKDLVKAMGRRVEEAKISVRNVRRDAQEKLRRLEKDGEESQDDVRRALDQLQKHTDSAVGDIDASSKRKEKEVMEV